MMKVVMKKIVIMLPLSGLLMGANATAANKAESMTLLCQTHRIVDGGEVPMSLILNESTRSAIINGQAFQGVNFTPYRIEGVALTPHQLIPGVDREYSFWLDRVTGKFSYMLLTQPADGGEYTEQQKARIVSLPPDPSFMGSCKPSRPMF